MSEEKRTFACSLLFVSSSSLALPTSLAARYQGRATSAPLLWMGGVHLLERKRWTCGLKRSAGLTCQGPTHTGPGSTPESKAEGRSLALAHQKSRRRGYIVILARPPSRSRPSSSDSPTAINRKSAVQLSGDVPLFVCILDSVRHFTITITTLTASRSRASEGRWWSRPRSTQTRGSSALVVIAWSQVDSPGLALLRFE